GSADEAGKFALTIQLVPDGMNEITVTATDAAGEARKRSFVIRHDGGFSGEEQKPRKAAAVGGGVLPRSIGIRVSGQDDMLGVIISGQTEVPCSVENTDYLITSQVPGAAGVAECDVYEGDLPYAPLNTHLAALLLQTAASPSLAEPVVLEFQITEDHLLTATARMANFPDHVVSAKVDCKSPSGAKQHVLERTDRFLNIYVDKLRPEDKAKLSRSKQALIDLVEQYRRSPQKDCYDRIKETGLQLKADLDRVEGSLG
ncbi:MAG: hypothetical protein ACYS8K_10515, partial [Planctomycetota bacterium]